MVRFEIKLRTKVEGIPQAGPNILFEPGAIYEAASCAETLILRNCPSHVAEEVKVDGEAPVGKALGELELTAPVPEIVAEGPGNEEDSAPIPPSELEIAHAKQAFRDDLVTTSQRVLWDRTFPDGSAYKAVWKHGMKKGEFVEKILEEIANQETTPG